MHKGKLGRLYLLVCVFSLVGGCNKYDNGLYKKTAKKYINE